MGRSQSKVDNVETIFARNLPEGMYKIVVKSDAKDTFGLAWDADYLDEPASLIASPDPKRLLRRVRGDEVGVASAPGSGFGRAVPEPSMMGGIAVGMMLMGRRRRG